MNDNESLLLHKKWTGLISPQESSQLEALLSSDPAFRLEAEKMESIWAQSASPSPQGYQPNIEKAWARFKDQIHAPAAAPARPPAKVISIRLLRRAAAVLILLVAALFLLPNLSEVKLLAGKDPISTRPNEAVIAHTLPDGSVFWMNEESTISFPDVAGKSERRVRLSGEAYFKVKKNRRAPFIIETPAGEVRVLGTSFNVKAYPGSDTEEVFVTTGTVRFTARENGKQQTLEKKQAAVLKKSTLQFTDPGGRTAADVLQWRENVLNFRKTPLHEILKALERHYGFRFNQEKLDRGIIECPFTVSFELAKNEQDAINFLRKATALEAARSESDPKTILLSGGFCTD